MASTLKFSPPTWNSDKASPTWRDFCHQFESFVDYQAHGSVLPDLACKVLGKSRNFVASKHTQVDDAISYVLPEANEADNNDGEDAEAAQAPERVVNSVADLTPEEVALDRSMHNILDNCVLGSKRTALTTIQTRSWIQAWVSLHREMGATTIKRKTVIIGDLIKMEFEPSPAKFKQATLDLVQRFYETNITMEELMMYCITQSFPEEYRWMPKSIFGHQPPLRIRLRIRRPSLTTTSSHLNTLVRNPWLSPFHTSPLAMVRRVGILDSGADQHAFAVCAPELRSAPSPTTHTLPLPGTHPKFEQHRDKRIARCFCYGQPRVPNSSVMRGAHLEFAVRALKLPPAP